MTFAAKESVKKMGRLVDEDAAIDALDILCQEHRYRIPGKVETYSQYNEAWQDALDRAEGAIGDLPSVQPERKRGKWEYHSNPNIRGGMNPEDAYCSVCGFHTCTSEVNNFDDYNFCPNCGADMRQREE